MADQGQKRSSGVDELVARLREEGVAAGRAEAERIVAEAEVRARRLLDAAEAEAEAKRDAARREIDAHRRAGEDALKAAARDTVLDLKDKLSRRFAADVEKLVSEAMADPAMLRAMILAVCGRARAEAGVDGAPAVEVILPRTAVDLDSLRRKPEDLEEGGLAHFAVAVAGDMLRAGVSFAPAEDDAGGLRLSLTDRGVSIDLSDRAVAAVLLAHLQPRFRALLEGAVR